MKSYLHNKCAVLVALLGQGVQLGNGVVEGVFGQARFKLRMEQCDVITYLQAWSGSLRIS